MEVASSTYSNAFWHHIKHCHIIFRHEQILCLAFPPAGRLSGSACYHADVIYQPALVRHSPGETTTPGAAEYVYENQPQIL